MKVKKIEPMSFRLRVLDPFIIAIHHRDEYPVGNEKSEPLEYLPNRVEGQDFDLEAPWRMYHGKTVPGFPVHPHRGFETVTVMIEGYADHFDSKGSSGRYGEGDTQWMTAGEGVQHSEMFPLLKTDAPNPMELFQIWLNLPAKDKFAPPDYKMFWNEKTPRITVRDQNGKASHIKLIAGTYDGVKAITPPKSSWAADPKNNVSIWIIEMDPQAELTLPKVSATMGRMLYHYRGDGKTIDVEGQTLPIMHLAELDGGEAITIKNGNGHEKLLLLEGEPINEPVVAHGPFVMNTKEEILQAIKDYQDTEFGGWPWERRDPINDKHAGRFASHNHGKKVEKPE